MKQWSLTLHGPGGIRSQFDSLEAQFVLGSEEATDVLKVEDEGVAPRHAWVWIAEGVRTTHAMRRFSSSRKPSPSFTTALTGCALCARRQRGSL